MEKEMSDLMYELLHVLRDSKAINRKKCVECNVPSLLLDGNGYCVGCKLNVLFFNKTARRNRENRGMKKT